ncbi:MAG: hypothetical protein ACREU3_11890 [Steroidobacteraceae bacterium]
MSADFTESVVEEAALAGLQSDGSQTIHGPDIAPDLPAGERANCGEVMFAHRWRRARPPKLVAEALRARDPDRIAGRVV